MSFQTNHLTIHRHRQAVLKDLNVAVRPGELVGVLGANGAGKSTLLAAMAGELAATQGTVLLDDLRLDQLSALEQSQRRAVLPQNPSLSFELTVWDVAQMGAYPYSAARADEVKSWVYEALRLAQLLPQQESMYTQLSGGEQQRVHIARAWVQCFAIEQARGEAYLLLDEPLSSLDPKYQMLVMGVFEQFTRERAVGVVMVMHDLNMAARFGQRLILLHEGQVIAQGTPESVLTADLLKRAYGLECTVIQHPLDTNRLLILC